MLNIKPEKKRQINGHCISTNMHPVLSNNALLILFQVSFIFETLQIRIEFLWNINTNPIVFLSLQGSHYPEFGVQLSPAHFYTTVTTYVAVIEHCFAHLKVYLNGTTVDIMLSDFLTSIACFCDLSVMFHIGQIHIFLLLYNILAYENSTINLFHH